MSLVADGVQCTLPLRYSEWRPSGNSGNVSLSLLDFEPQTNFRGPDVNTLYLLIQVKGADTHSKAANRIDYWTPDGVSRVAPVPSDQGFSYYARSSAPFFAKYDSSGRAIHVEKRGGGFSRVVVHREYNRHLQLYYLFSLERFEEFDTVDSNVMDFVGKYCAFGAAAGR